MTNSSSLYKWKFSDPKQSGLVASWSVMISHATSRVVKNVSPEFDSFFYYLSQNVNPADRIRSFCSQSIANDCWYSRDLVYDIICHQFLMEFYTIQTSPLVQGEMSTGVKNINQSSLTIVSKVLEKHSGLFEMSVFICLARQRLLNLILLVCVCKSCLPARSGPSYFRCKQLVCGDCWLIYDRWMNTMEGRGLIKQTIQERY